MEAMCANHPEKSARSICHSCGRSYCMECLTEGVQYYYCASAECQNAFQRAELPEIITCPRCTMELELSRKERAAKKFWCPCCRQLIDLTDSDGSRVELFTAEDAANDDARAMDTAASDDALSSPPEAISAHGRAQAVIALLIVIALVDLISIGGYAVQFELVSRVAAGDDISSTVANGSDFLRAAITVVQAALYCVSVVLFLMWFHRAHRVLPSLGAENLEHSPRWAVASFFVPIVSWYVPFRVACEIWQASEPETADGTSWAILKTPRILAWWWGLFLLQSVAGFAVEIALKDQETFEGLLQMTLFLLASDVATLAAALVTVQMVKSVDERQERKFRLLTQAAVLNANMVHAGVAAP